MSIEIVTDPDQASPHNGRTLQKAMSPSARSIGCKPQQPTETKPWTPNGSSGAREAFLSVSRNLGVPVEKRAKNIISKIHNELEYTVLSQEEAGNVTLWIL